MCLISSIKAYLHASVFVGIFSLWLIRKTYFFCLIFGLSFLSAQVEQRYSFTWDSNQNAFSNNGEIFPTLNLFENCFYLFEASGAEFTITETNGSIFVGNEIFANQIGGENQYILLKASASTPSTLFYKNLGFPDSHGEINIIPYLGFDLLKMQNPQQFAKYGSSVEIGFEGEILIGAPGFNNNEGLIEQISFNDEDNYSHELSISSPLNGNVGFGSSISVDLDTSFFLTGVPNADSFLGKLLSFGNSQQTPLEIAQGSTSGDLLGWSSSISGSRFAFSSLSMNDPNGGCVSIYDFSSAQTIPLFEKLKPLVSQFANEFGQSLHLDDDLLLVGAPGEDDLIREESGSAYIFRIDGNSTTQTKILPSDRSSGDRFGHSVYLNKDLIFIGAPFGDGLISDSGVLHVFQYDAENLEVVELSKILPPIIEANQKFAHSIVSTGDFIFIAAPNAGVHGEVYIYCKSENSFNWELQETIKLQEYITNSDSAEEIYLSVQEGVLAIGLPGESSIQPSSGAVKVFHNPAWDFSSLPHLPPFFENNSFLSYNAVEDIGIIEIDFNASHPFLAENLISWEINSTHVPENSYDINASTGVFKFMPPGDLSGSVSFNLQAISQGQRMLHDFSVVLDPVQDPPVFLAPGFSLPDATVGESYSHLIEAFDPDADTLALTLVSGSLPNGLTLNNFLIEGIPLEEGNFSLGFRLSDGNVDINTTFTIEVHESNAAPLISYNGNGLASPSALSLNLMENFSLEDWNTLISNLQVSDADNDVVRMQVLQSPESGFLSIHDTFENNGTSIKYFPNFNFWGDDSFTIRFSDNHVAIPKTHDLTINLSIESRNSSPIITSDDPLDSALEGVTYRHTFNIYDGDGDLGNLTFQNLPSWLNFDNVRTIFGKPSRSDYQESSQSFFVTVSDENGGKFSQSITIDIIPENYPPVITYEDVSLAYANLNVIEDGDPVIFELSAYDPDSNLSTLLWEISKLPNSGNVNEITQSSSNSQFSYQSDGNFSGKDTLEVLVYEESDPLSFDTITIDFLVDNRADPPSFGSQPFPGLLINEPWEFNVEGIDPDKSDILTLKSLTNLPDWLSLVQSSQRTWTFKGFPQSMAEVPIHLELSDGNTTVSQEYILEVLSELEPLEFLDLVPPSVELTEDSNWTFALLRVNSIDEVQVRWNVVQSPQNGNFIFTKGTNGSISDLTYIPAEHFFGSDKIILEATDGYSSVEAIIEFAVEGVADTPLFLEIPQGIISAENEKFDFLLSYEDGDGINTTELIISGMPSWLSKEMLSESTFSRTFRFFGQPSVDQIGSYEMGANIKSLNDNLNTSTNFTLQVNYLNQPPVPNFTSISAEVLEDSYKEWQNFISATDNESQANELTWSIVSAPENGYAQISENGNQLSYSPDSNYSGLDYFSIGVIDNGGVQNSLPQQVTIPVSINVTQLDDAPFFASSPPTDSNLPDVISWNDEEDYIYNVLVVDSDWPWQGYPEIQLRSSLPNWATWNNLGQGRALISGSPKWFDEGNYTFSIEARSGNDLIRQDFSLVIRVDDYPPRVQTSSGSEINGAIKIFIVEDDHRGEVNEAVLDLRAYNPDEQPGDSLGWRILVEPSSGATISNLESMKNGEFTMISTFNYFPPLHFNGIDRFVLVADEGDRLTQVPFEVHVKSVQDAPIFTSNSPLEITAALGSYFEEEINAYDPDKQLINFKLLYPPRDSKWLQIKSHTNDSNGSIITIGGVVPRESSSGSYTLIASDPSGRFSLLNIQLVTD